MPVLGIVLPQLARVHCRGREHLRDLIWRNATPLLAVMLSHSASAAVAKPTA
jgi:hypothetical protein